MNKSIELSLTPSNNKLYLRRSAKICSNVGIALLIIASLGALGIGLQSHFFHSIGSIVNHQDSMTFIVGGGIGLASSIFFLYLNNKRKSEEKTASSDNKDEGILKSGTSVPVPSSAENEEDYEEKETNTTVRNDVTPPKQSPSNEMNEEDYEEKDTNSVVVHDVSSVEVKNSIEKKKEKPSEVNESIVPLTTETVTVDDDPKRIKDAEKFEKNLEKSKQAFKKQAKARLNGKNSKAIRKPKKLNDKELAHLKAAMPFYDSIRERKDQGIISHDGGDHYVFEVKTIPGWIFKVSQTIPKDKEHASKYKELREKSKNICQQIYQERKTLLLYAPNCEIYPMEDGTYVIAEEMIPNLNGDYLFQRGLFLWGLNDKETGPYFKELFIQLALYTCLMEFADFKYNNVPLDPSGLACLIDSDSEDVVAGLTWGHAAGANGLLNYLSEDLLKEILPIINQKLDPEKYEEVKKRIDSNKVQVGDILKALKDSLTKKRYRSKLEHELVADYKAILEELTGAPDLTRGEFLEIVKEHVTPEQYQNIDLKAKVAEEENKLLKVVNNALGPLNDEKYTKILFAIIKRKKLNKLIKEKANTLNSDELFAVIKKHLSEREYRKIEKILKPIPTRLRQRAQKRAEYKAFLQKNGITKTSDPISVDGFDSITFEGNKPQIQKRIAACLIEHLNDELLNEKDRSYDFLMSRRIEISIKDTDSFLDRYKEKYDNHHMISPYISSALKALQNGGKIYRYKLSLEAGVVVIYC